MAWNVRGVGRLAPWGWPAGGPGRLAPTCRHFGQGGAPNITIVFYVYFVPGYFRAFSGLLTHADGSHCHLSPMGGMRVALLKTQDTVCGFT